MSELSREQFHNLIGQVRANGSFPDEPLLAVYDALRTRCEAAENERIEWVKRAERAEVLTNDLTAQLATIGEEHAVTIIALRKAHQDTVQNLQRQLAPTTYARDFMAQAHAAACQERDAAQNELCTAKDQIPPDMDGDSLSVALIKLKDERHAAQDEARRLREILLQGLQLVRMAFSWIGNGSGSRESIQGWMQTAQQALTQPVGGAE